MTTATKKSFTRNYTCAHCGSEYETPKYTASASRFCTRKCRDATLNAKTKKKKEQLTSRRLLKLPSNDFFLWVAREAKRAGTVEILSGHTVESLEQLHQLYLAKIRCFGYNPELKKSKFHLCHIHASVTDDRIGLLHPANLFIGGAFQNQVNGNKVAPYVGMAISRSILKSEWLVDKDDTDRRVLDKISKYLGPTLKAYAEQYPIDRSARFVLIDWIIHHQHDYLSSVEEYDLPSFEVPFLRSDLDKKSTADLRKIRAEIEGREAFTIKLNPARSFAVYFSEIIRLSECLPDSRHRDDLIWLTDVIRIGATFLRQELAASDDKLNNIVQSLPGIHHRHFTLKQNKDLGKFRDWLSFTMFNALQGFPVDRDLVANTLKGYLIANYARIDYSKLEEDIWCAGMYDEQIEIHKAQMELLNNSSMLLNIEFDLINTSSEVDEVLLPRKVIAKVQKPISQPMFGNLPEPFYTDDLSSAPF